MKAIILKLFQTEYCPGGIWTAEHYVDGKPDPYIVDLFGTHSIATAFTHAMPADTVRALIAELNAEYEVSVG